MSASAVRFVWHSVFGRQTAPNKRIGLMTRSAVTRSPKSAAVDRLLVMAYFQR